LSTENIEGGVRVQFEGIPHGITLNELMIFGPPWDGQARVVAGEQADAGDTTIRVTASGGQAETSSDFSLRVVPLRKPDLPESSAATIPGPASDSGKSTSTNGSESTGSLETIRRVLEVIGLAVAVIGSIIALILGRK
jgi:hypothetical protein